MSDFEMAKDKVLMGSERRSMVISDEGEADHRLARGRAHASSAC
jgi:ATP-dependent Zn protease